MSGPGSVAGMFGTAMALVMLVSAPAYGEFEADQSDKRQVKAAEAIERFKEHMPRSQDYFENAYGYAIPNPMTINLITAALSLVVLMFSPINFPADRLPQWLNDLHAFLPFEHAANVVRAGLTDGLVDHVDRSFAVLAVWLVIAGLVTARVLARRR